MGAFKRTYTQVQLAQQSIELLENLTAHGLPTGWKQCGSLSLARTRDRMTVFRRMKSQSIGWGIDCDLLTPAQCRDRCPMLEVSDLIGGLWIPKDGIGDPHLTCHSLIAESLRMGVSVVEHCAVTEIVQEHGRVKAVRSGNGGADGAGHQTECVYFVNCGGFWARGIGQLSQPCVKVPLHAAEHYYLHTKPIDGLDPMTPVVRDLDGQIYLRENDGRLLCGGFELEAKAAYEDGTIPGKYMR